MKKIIAFAIGLVLLTGCKKEDDPGYSGPLGAVIDVKEFTVTSTEWINYGIPGQAGSYKYITHPQSIYPTFGFVQVEIVDGTVYTPLPYSYGSNIMDFEYSEAGVNIALVNTTTWNASVPASVTYRVIYTHY